MANESQTPEQDNANVSTPSVATFASEGDALWLVAGKITEEITRLSNDDFAANEDRITELRDLKGELTMFEEGFNVPETAYVNLEVVELFSRAGNTLPTAWKSANKRRMANPVNANNLYEEVIRVRPAMATAVLAPYLQKGQTQFPLTKKQVLQIQKSGIELISDEMYKFAVEFWQRGRTQYIRIAQSFDSLQDFEDAFADAGGFNDLFTVEAHKRNGLSFRGVEMVNIDLLQKAAEADGAEASLIMSSNKKVMAETTSALLTKLTTQGADALSANEIALINALK